MVWHCFIVCTQRQASKARQATPRWKDCEGGLSLWVLNACESLFVVGQDTYCPAVVPARYHLGSPVWAPPEPSISAACTIFTPNCLFNGCLHLTHLCRQATAAKKLGCYDDYAVYYPCYPGYQGDASALRESGGCATAWVHSLCMPQQLEGL